MPAGIDDFDVAMGSTPPDDGRVNWKAVEMLLERDRLAEEQQIKAEQQAIRYAGHQEYQSLVDAGATPEEALRRTAHKLYYNSPQGLTSALRYTNPVPEMGSGQFTPINYPDTGKQAGYIFTTPSGREQFVPTGRGDDRARETLDREMARTEFEKADKAVGAVEKGLTTPGSGIYKSAKGTNDLNAAQAARDASIERRYNLVGVTNAPAKATAAQEKASPFKEGQLVRNKRDGKLYKIVKGEPVEQSE